MAGNVDTTIKPGFAGRLGDVRAAIETRLSELLPESGNERDLVALAMRESTLAPGKRMRPVLLVLAAEGLAENNRDHDNQASRQAVDLGCAVEMIHAASLVLDDMPCMDNAALRRGQPTVHLKFGEDVAILTAIALLSRAFGVVATISDLAATTRTELVEVLANTVGMQGLVRGQFQDLRDGAVWRHHGHGLAHQRRCAIAATTAAELRHGAGAGLPDVRRSARPLRRQ
jgi:geranylgeranyl diphosphate synthase type II